MEGGGSELEVGWVGRRDWRGKSKSERGGNVSSPLLNNHARKRRPGTQERTIQPPEKQPDEGLDSVGYGLEGSGKGVGQHEFRSVDWKRAQTKPSIGVPAWKRRKNSSSGSVGAIWNSLLIKDKKGKKKKQDKAGVLLNSKEQGRMVDCGP